MIKPCISRNIKKEITATTPCISRNIKKEITATTPCISRSIKKEITATKNFYKEGIRFKCQGSARCCRFHGPYGYVYLSLADRRRLAVHLGMPTRSFTLRHTDKTDGLFHLKQLTSDCPFLKEKQCMVYDARPGQCRTWPFWPENMKPGVWKRKVLSFCPGLGKGKLYSAKKQTRFLVAVKFLLFTATYAGLSQSEF